MFDLLNVEAVKESFSFVYFAWLVADIIGTIGGNHTVYSNRFYLYYDPSLKDKIFCFGMTLGNIVALVYKMIAMVVAGFIFIAIVPLASTHLQAFFLMMIIFGSVLVSGEFIRGYIDDK